MTRNKETAASCIDLRSEKSCSDAFSQTDVTNNSVNESLTNASSRNIKHENGTLKKTLVFVLKLSIMDEY